MSAHSAWVTAALAVAAIPFLGASLYLALLALLARHTPSAAASTSTRFDVVVPAHNEESGIQETLRSLRAMDYPRDRFRIVVVADNCIDRTADRARDAGVVVLERTDSLRRGKGYALSLAYEWSLAAGLADAVVVVDADTVVSSNLLSAFSRRFDDGALAVQAEYGVSNSERSWRTRLLLIAFTLFHAVRSSARERLGLSTGLRGNGMAFTAHLLRTTPSKAYSIVEDVEYGCALGLEGIRVAYAGDAWVLSDMPATSTDARSQRQRWEGGRLALVREYVPALVSRGIVRRSAMMLDLAIDLLIPPLSTIGLSIAIGLALSLGTYAAAVTTGMPAVLWTAALLALSAYVARGAVMARVGPRVLLDLAWAPVYAVWKLTLLFRRSGSPRGAWVRTSRKPFTKGT